jgi:hypothetical protein
MQLQIARSKQTKTKMFGGSETVYVLSLRATVPEHEAKLLKEYAEEGVFVVSDEVSDLMSDKRLEGPTLVPLTDLIRGVEYKSKSVYTAVTDLPRHFFEDFTRRLGRIRVQETWGGNATLQISYAEMLHEQNEA